MHLNAPGWNVIGSGEPALPGVAIGHNERIAWGITIVGTDQTDLFVEQTHPDDPTKYKVGDEWQPMRIVKEKIAVKGQTTAQEIELRFTRHGPVIYQDNTTHRAFALKWAGSEPGGAAYLAALAVDRAGDQKEFLAALERWKTPSLNFVYADKTGTIGWVATALTPVRPKHDGLLPVRGNGGFEWTGYLAVKDLPQTFNPKTGWIATANHNILPEGYQQQIGYEFAAPFRFQRIKQYLQATEKFDLADFQKLQQDCLSLPGQRLARLLKEVELKDPALEPYAKMIRGWDGSLSVDSQAGPIYEHWLPALQDAVYAPHAPKELRKDLAAKSGLATMLKALEQPSETWFGPDPKAARDRLVASSFAAAVAEVKKRWPTPDQLRWGSMHGITFRHPLAPQNPAYQETFNIGPFQRGGDGTTVNNTSFDGSFQQIHGATYRQLFDLADWDKGLATSAPGQSGQPASPHYADLAPLWAAGRYFPLAYSRQKVEEVTRHRLWLKPGK